MQVYCRLFSCQPLYLLVLIVVVWWEPLKVLFSFRSQRVFFHSEVVDLHFIYQFLFVTNSDQVCLVRHAMYASLIPRLRTVRLICDCALALKFACQFLIVKLGLHQLVHHVNLFLPCFNRGNHCIDARVSMPRE